MRVIRNAFGFSLAIEPRAFNALLLFSRDSQELLAYKEKFGNVDVAVRKGFEAYKQLANWAGLQRVSVSQWQCLTRKMRLIFGAV